MLDSLRESAWGKRIIKGGLLLAGLLFAMFVISLFTSNWGTSPENIRGDRDVPEEVIVEKPPEIKKYTDNKLVAIARVDEFGGVIPGFAYYYSFPLWFGYAGFIGLVLFGLFFAKDEWLFYVLAILYIVLWYNMPSIDFIPSDFEERTEYVIEK